MSDDLRKKYIKGIDEYPYIHKEDIDKIIEKLEDLEKRVQVLEDVKGVL